MKYQDTIMEALKSAELTPAQKEGIVLLSLKINPHLEFKLTDISIGMNAIAYGLQHKSCELERVSELYAKSAVSNQELTEKLAQACEDRSELLDSCRRLRAERDEYRNRYELLLHSHTKVWGFTLNDCYRHFSYFINWVCRKLGMKIPLLCAYIIKTARSSCAETRNYISDMMLVLNVKNLHNVNNMKVFGNNLKFDSKICDQLIIDNNGSVTHNNNDKS